MMPAPSERTRAAYRKINAARREREGAASSAALKAESEAPLGADWLEKTLTADYTIVAYPDEARHQLGLRLWCVLCDDGAMMGSMDTLDGAIRLLLILTGAATYDLPSEAA